MVLLADQGERKRCWLRVELTRDDAALQRGKNRDRAQEEKKRGLQEKGLMCP